MIWLGSRRGYLSDWITQRWVQFTGRKVSVRAEAWLAGPIAPTQGIGSEFFESCALQQGLKLERPRGPAGIMADFSELRSDTFDPRSIQPEVVAFYEKTNAYELDAWSEWCGVFRPFGWLLATIFSRRLQQLNVPLSSLDTSRGMTNEVLRFHDAEGVLRQTAWFRRLRSSGHILYAGFYSVCQLPGCSDPCVKVVFPLPNGNAIVIMRAECRSDGSLLIVSAGKRFGDPGFYFTVDAGDGMVWTRYLRSLQESIHVFRGEENTSRADHILKLWKITFLRLHYRMRFLGTVSEPTKGDVLAESKPFLS